MARRSRLPGTTTASRSPDAREVPDTRIAGVVRGHVLAERDGKVWPGFDEEIIFELGIERCLLTLTRADGPFPAGLTIWKAGSEV